MSYHVKEAYYTLQGEGFYTGRAAVFCRFAGCNLWSGLEKDREEAVCKFCDTDFVGVDGPGGGHFDTAEDLALHISSLWKGDEINKFVVCTGGEPLLQMDEPLINAFHSNKLEIAIETNGTVPAPEGIDWICLSPKAGTDLKIIKGDELKLVYPQTGCDPEDYDNLEFDHFYLQPMDGDNMDKHTKSAIEYCLANPKWKLSLQTQKILKIS